MDSFAESGVDLPFSVMNTTAATNATTNTIADTINNGPSISLTSLLKDNSKMFRFSTNTVNNDRN